MNQMFHERFDIHVEMSEANKRFVNRVKNTIFGSYFWQFTESQRHNIIRTVATLLGIRYHYPMRLDNIVKNDFTVCLETLEALYKAVPAKKHELVKLIQGFLKMSEVDLEVRWGHGKFRRSGVKVLDDRLVNDPLHWLRDKRYENVLQPFEKGLDHFVSSESNPGLLSDVITDMYEALEALAKIVTKRPDKELSANQQLFLSKVKASEEYKRILAEYISYAQNFRHGTKAGRKKPSLTPKEVESFIYLTGIFIRLAMT